MLAGFEDISGLPEFAAIKEAAENSEVYETAQFEMQLFALRGKNVPTNPKAPITNTVTVTIDQDDKPESDDGYGGLVTRAKMRRR